MTVAPLEARPTLRHWRRDEDTVKTYILHSLSLADINNAAAALRARGFSCLLCASETAYGILYSLRADKPARNRAEQVARDLRDAPLRPDQRERLQREYAALCK